MIRRIVPISINPGRLLQELAGLPLDGSVSWVGHVRVSDRRYDVRTTRVLIRSSSINGVRKEEFCGPVGSGDTFEFGEVIFGTTRDLTPEEVSVLDARLAAHDFTVLSDEQIRQDQDAADLLVLLNAERDEFILALQTLTAVVNAWDGMTNAQRQAATKESVTATRDALRIVARVMRLFLRRELGAAI